MKKIFLVFFAVYLVPCALCLVPVTANAAIPWWMQPTICKPNPTNCYPNMGTGFDAGMWDASGKCRGLKYVCPAALTTTATDPVLMGKLDITSGAGISSDFDTDILGGDCFGARKTTSNGAQAMVNGKYVNVWCGGVLEHTNHPIPNNENLKNGQITLGAQPVCSDLAPHGFIAILDQKCYGKFYDPAQYYIECAGANVLPKRIIQLNGADAVTGTGSGNYNYPTDTAAAKKLFDDMQSVSTAQKAKYFKN